MSRPIPKVILVLLVLAFLPTTVQAADPVLTGHDCDAASYYPGMSPMFTDCWGAFDGNDAHFTSFILSTVNAAYPGTWTYYGKTDAGTTGGPFSSVTGGSSGILVFDSPITGPFVVTLKAGPSFAFYYYANSGTLSQISVNTYGVNPLNEGGNVNGLSHAGLLTTGTFRVPEPATFSLLGVGLLGLGLMGYRKRRT